MGAMPANCNGIERYDRTKDYSKYNCFWTFKKRGRRKIESKKEKITKKNVNSCTICLTLDKNHLDFIKKQAIYKSMQEGRNIETNDLIRDALKAQFPVAIQTDMFGSVK